MIDSPSSHSQLRSQPIRHAVALSHFRINLDLLPPLHRMVSTTAVIAAVVQ